MKLERYISLLRDLIGLDVSSVGTGLIESAIRERAEACADGDPERYWSRLQSSPEERHALIEAVVVPETWFFRDRGAFEALARFATLWLTRQPTERVLRILSIPCSTGEEPYTIAMTLLDAGIGASRFTIDAVDVSSRAIAVAQAGLYRKNSFRGSPLEFRDRYFERVEEGFRLADVVRQRVKFQQGNLLGVPSDPESAPYEVVFCRNLLIYFDRATQDRAVAALARCVGDAGVLFVGPSETGLMLSHHFVPASWAGAFAFNKPLAAPLPTRVARIQPRVARASQPSAKQRPSPVRTTVELPTAKSTPARTAPEPTSLALLQDAERFADAGDVAAARAACESFIRGHGAHARAFYLLALLDDAVGDTANATAHYRRVLYLDPNHHEALVHLAMLFDRTGDSQGALRLRERAKRISARGTST